MKKTNVEQRIVIEEKDKIKLWSGATSLFDVRRSMFDVGRSSFNLFDVHLSKSLKITRRSII